MPGEENAAPVETARRLALRIRRHSRRIIGRVVLGGVLLILAGWLLTGWLAWSDYGVALQAEERTSTILADALTQDLTRSLAALQPGFQAVAAGLRAGVPGSPAVQDTVRAALRASGDQSASMAVRVPGNRPLLIGRDAGPPPPASDGITWSGRHMLVTRWLPLPSGSPAAAEVMLDPAHLLAPGPAAGRLMKSQILVATPDGALRAAFQPGNADGLEGPAGTLQALDGHQARLLSPGGVVTFPATGADGVRRMITLGQVAGNPLLVALVRPLKDVLAHQRRRLWLLALGRVVATAVIAGLTLLLAHEVRRRTAREIELAYDKVRLSRAEARIAADRKQLAAADGDLQASRHQLAAANHIRTRFIAHMSHELRTPLHAIIGFAELIRDQALPFPPGSPAAAYAQDIWSSGRHLLALINDVLDLAKVDSGTVTLREEPVNVAALMQDSLTAVRNQAAEQGVMLEAYMAPPDVVIVGDRTRLLQVLINLLANAVKFTPKNGMVTFDAILNEAKELVFNVTDTGSGMTEAEIAIALEPFGQVDNSAARRSQGTGLGLPIAVRMAQLHGGDLAITSVKGEGTRVAVSLPAARVRVAADGGSGQSRSALA